MKEIPFVYFGGEPLGVPVLEQLQITGMMPVAVVASPDKPVGRKQVMAPPPVKVWAGSHGVPVWQPDGWCGEVARKNAEHFFAPLLEKHSDVVFVVVAYNHILPQWLLDLSSKGVVNVHPSLLPKLRGASPIRTAIMNNLRDHIGVSIMLLDEQMDHGPILKQVSVNIPDSAWPMAGLELDTLLAKAGGELLAKTLPEFVCDDIVPQPQDHSQATYCGRLTKADSEIVVDPHDLPVKETAYAILHKFHAFAGMGGVWFMYNDARVKITDLSVVDERLEILKVTPAGSVEQEFSVWLHNQQK